MPSSGPWPQSSAWGSSRVLYGMEDLFDRFWPGPDWLRPATGGVLLGLLLLVLPEMYGVGYPVLEGGIRGHYSGGFLLLLLVGKLIAVSLTIAIGGSGGVFAPSLFMGAMLGTAFGDLAQHVLPGLTGSPGTYGLIGMGAVFAGAARAPITAVLIVFELTGDYTVILPLMTAIVLAAGVSNLISSETIYTLKLHRRGIDILRGRSVNPDAGPAGGGRHGGDAYRRPRGQPPQRAHRPVRSRGSGRPARGRRRRRLSRHHHVRGAGAQRPGGPARCDRRPTGAHDVHRAEGSDLGSRARDPGEQRPGRSAGALRRRLPGRRLDHPPRRAPGLRPAAPWQRRRRRGRPNGEGHPRTPRAPPRSSRTTDAQDFSPQASRHPATAVPRRRGGAPRRR